MKDSSETSKLSEDTIAATPSEPYPISQCDETALLENQLQDAPLPDFIRRAESEESQPGAFAIPGIEALTLRRQERILFRVNSRSSRSPPELLISAFAVDEEQPSLFVEASPLSIHKGTWKWIAALSLLLTLLICSIVYGSMQTSFHGNKSSEADQLQSSEGNNPDKAATTLSNESQMPTAADSWETSATATSNPWSAPSTAPSVYVPWWKKVGQDIVGEQANSNFGLHVALSNSGNAMAVGSHLHDSENLQDVGIVRIYELDSYNAWRQVGQDLFGSAAREQFGWVLELSLDGSIVAVGTLTGLVWAYEYNRAFDFWYPLGPPIGVGGTEVPSLGVSLSLSDDGMTLATGADLIDGYGAVMQIFQYSRMVDNWIPRAQESYGERLSGSDLLGPVVRLSGNGEVAAIGWVGHDSEIGVNVGQVQVYTVFQTNSTWGTFGGALVGASSEEALGTAISLSENGLVLALTSRSAIFIYHYDMEIQDWIIDDVDYNLTSDDKFLLPTNTTLIDISLKCQRLVVSRAVSDSLTGSVSVFSLNNGTDNRWTLVEDPSQAIHATEITGVPSVVMSDNGLLAMGFPTFGSENVKNVGIVRTVALA